MASEQAEQRAQQKRDVCQSTRTGEPVPGLEGAGAGVPAALATFSSIFSVAGTTSTGPPSARIDRSPRITCSDPLTGAQGSAAPLVPGGSW